MIPEGMKRRSIDLPLEHVEAFEAAERQDGLSPSTRLAALVQLWFTDPETQRRTAPIAQEISAQKLRRKQAGAAATRKRRWPAKGPDSTS